MIRHYRETAFLVAFLVCAGAGALSAQASRRSDAVQDGLVGRVRSVQGTTTRAERIDGKLGQQAAGKPIDSASYDADGRILERAPIDSYGFPIARQTFRYDKGRLVEVVLRDPDGMLLEREEYAYGSGLEPVSSKVSDDSGQALVARYTRGVGERSEQIA